MFSIETDRLLLRDFGPDDFEAFYETSNDPAYRRYYAEQETTRTYWEEIFDRIQAGSEAAERTIYQLAVCLQNGELIGTCGVRIESLEHQQASFGCAIAQPYWGEGYAYEASRSLIGYGFSSLPVQRVYAETVSENVRARALAARLGMRLEGELRQHKFFKGRWWNTVIYAVLKEEWHAYVGI